MRINSVVDGRRLRVGPILVFFSSRRRHTRYWRDWSSDVCSSDLTVDLFTSTQSGASTARTSRTTDSTAVRSATPPAPIGVGTHRNTTSAPGTADPDRKSVV